MNNKKPTSERVFRELTQAERVRLEIARAESETAKDAILAEGKLRKQAWDAMRSDAERVIAELKAERERQGLSLVDVKRLCGLKRNSLSRLENDPAANPTLLTLQRYAAALKLSIATLVKAVRNGLRHESRRRSGRDEEGNMNYRYHSFRYFSQFVTTWLMMFCAETERIADSCLYFSLSLLRSAGGSLHCMAPPGRSLGTSC